MTSRSIPPASDILAEMPVPAPPPTIGLPTATLARSFSRIDWRENIRFNSTIHRRVAKRERATSDGGARGWADRRPGDTSLAAAWGDQVEPDVELVEKRQQFDELAHVPLNHEAAVGEAGHDVRAPEHNGDQGRSGGGHGGAGVGRLLARLIRQGRILERQQVLFFRVGEVPVEFDRPSSGTRA